MPGQSPQREWFARAAGSMKGKAIAALRDVRKQQGAVSSSHSHRRPLSLAAPHAVKERGGAIIAVGTTSVRTLESLPADALTSSDSCGGFRGSTANLTDPRRIPRVRRGIDEAVPSLTDSRRTRGIHAESHGFRADSASSRRIPGTRGGSRHPPTGSARPTVRAWHHADERPVRIPR